MFDGDQTHNGQVSTDYDSDTLNHSPH